jgi:hypothetical protein
MRAGALMRKLRTRRRFIRPKTTVCGSHGRWRRGRYGLHGRTQIAPDAPLQLRREIKQALRDAFYDDSCEWRAMVVDRARVPVLRVLKSAS